MKKWIVATGLIAGSACWGTSIPTGLSATEIGDLGRILAMGGATRLLRTAESYPSWPGVKLGVELTMVPVDEITVMGNQNGSLPDILPMARIYLAKGLFDNVELIFSFLPFGLNSLSSIGGILKWNFVNERTSWASVAGLVGITGTNAFKNEFEAANLEMGVVASKDYTRLKPFVIASLMFARGKVDSALTSVLPDTGTLVGSHLALGAEWELPVHLTLEIDFYNFSPFASFFIGKKW